MEWSLKGTEPFYCLQAMRGGAYAPWHRNAVRRLFRKL